MNQLSLASAAALVPFMPLESKTACKVCNTSLKEGQIKRCGKCRTAIYCGRDCQAKDWSTHKVTCGQELSQKTNAISSAAAAVIPVKTSVPNQEKNTATSVYESESKEQSSLSAYYEERAAKVQAALKIEGKKSEHVTKTRELILEGMSHLNLKDSYVVVFGAQLVDDEPVEPLQQLLDKSAGLILVDVSQKTLTALHEKLGFSDRVKLVVKDLSFSETRLAAFVKEVESVNSPEEFDKRVINLYEALITDMNKDPERLSLLEIGGDCKIGYAISSLVALELGSNIGIKVEKIGDQKFGTYNESFMAGAKRTLLTQNLIASHLTFLKTLAYRDSSNSGCYFADTFQLRTGNKIYPTIHPQFLLKALKTFFMPESAHKGIQIVKEWNWMGNDKKNYKVQGFFIAR